MAKQQLTWKEAINSVLANSPNALHYDEITKEILDRELRTTLGATPAATVNAQISESIKHDGDNSPYLRVGKGLFTLRNRSSISSIITAPEKITENLKPNKSSTPTSVEPDIEDPQYAVISSFGMFWKREAIEWVRSPKILGVQQLGASSVDFSSQLGIYLLYDGREIVYVGRSTDRPLGTRLYEHTKDRLAVRWDRFSWFGLRPVDSKGVLGQLPEQFAAELIIPALEAVLIEALEPRQNRKRGDDLSSVEYMQQLDPAVELKRKQALFDELRPK